MIYIDYRRLCTTHERGSMRLCWKGYRQACRALIGGIDNYAGSGTILYFYDRKVVEALPGQP